MLQNHDDLPMDVLSVGATRPAVIKGFNVPFPFLIPVVGFPLIFVSLTRNPFWFALIPALTLLARWLVARDHNRPRVLWLALISGGFLADHRSWGGDSTDPLHHG